ncbi:hypothetical protein HT102_02765 [Hoyosella sp. G463]|uniref:Uncharacterized protein n=1 Tax=Lolliginicoccus lacisalsi TaxID=2742202 RepID=A0A927JAA7_9ACTN|nr:hypothetical protein [Lolliginicoccus lacisalsi]MBD8505411.1 hypothetical protein [Lolliginicoccus lacisalsi]
MPDPADRFAPDAPGTRDGASVEIDPGIFALLAAVLVLVLVGSFALPHTGAANGWDVLVSSEAAREQSVKVMSQLFVWFALVFGAGFSIVSLITRRWAAALIASGGSFVGAVLGMLAVWSRQTPTAADLATASDAGPGAGLILGLVALGALFLTWFSVAVSRAPAAAR